MLLGEPLEPVGQCARGDALHARAGRRHRGSCLLHGTRGRRRCAGLLGTSVRTAHDAGAARRKLARGADRGGAGAASGAPASTSMVVESQRLARRAARLRCGLSSATWGGFIDESACRTSSLSSPARACVSGCRDCPRAANSGSSASASDAELSSPASAPARRSVAARMSRAPCIVSAGMPGWARMRRAASRIASTGRATWSCTCALTRAMAARTRGEALSDADVGVPGVVDDMNAHLHR